MFCIDNVRKSVYYNSRYITMIIMWEEGSVRAAKNKDYERHDHQCSH